MGSVASGRVHPGRAVPHHLVKPEIHVRIVNEGGPAIRLGQEGRPIGAPIEPGEVIYAGPARLLAFSTIPYWGWGARIFPYAEERDDRFNLRVVNFGSIAAVANVRDIWRGSGSQAERQLSHRARCR